jgi:hypothetical protein
MAFLKVIAPKTLLFAVLALPSLIANAYAQQEALKGTSFKPFATAAQSTWRALPKTDLSDQRARARPTWCDPAAWPVSGRLLQLSCPFLQC